jgi:hypothetical protein
MRWRLSALPSASTIQQPTHSSSLDKMHAGPWLPFIPKHWNASGNFMDLGPYVHPKRRQAARPHTHQCDRHVQRQTSVHKDWPGPIVRRPIHTDSPGPIGTAQRPAVLLLPGPIVITQQTANSRLTSSPSPTGVRAAAPPPTCRAPTARHHSCCCRRPVLQARNPWGCPYAIQVCQDPPALHT